MGNGVTVCDIRHTSETVLPHLVAPLPTQELKGIHGQVTMWPLTATGISLTHQVSTWMHSHHHSNIQKHTHGHNI